jgi:excisionase family DNA binding protein
MNTEHGKLLIKVEEAGKLISVGRAKAYQMAQSGEMPGVVRMGRSVRVSAAALGDWVRKQTEAGSAHA